MREVMILMADVISTEMPDRAEDRRGHRPWRVHNEELPSEPGKRGGVRQWLPETAGEGHSDFNHVETGFSLIETSYRPARDLAVLSRIEAGEPRLVLTLGLAGRSSFAGNAGDEIDFRAGFATITTFAASVGERRYKGGQEVQQLRLSLSKHWLESELGEDKVRGWFGQRETRVVSQRPISAEAISAVRQTARERLPDGLESVYLRGLALSLLATELAPLFGGEPIGSNPRDIRDEQLACRARDILLAEYRDPPSVETLARRVGTNQLKLKMLFHRYFRNTPYGIVLDARMAAAYRLLERERWPVAIVADRVGYRHPGNFSAAFSRYFGFPPKTLAAKKP